MPPRDWTAQDGEAFKGAAEIMLKNILVPAPVRRDVGRRTRRRCTAGEP
ncbi:hypothetical protein AB0B89_04740 [Sphaerisporangium sp. NPDC049002]